MVRSLSNSVNSLNLVVGVNMRIFTYDDINSCWPDYAIEYLADILNGTYSVTDAREDLESLIASEYDPRAGGDSENLKCPITFLK